MTIRAVADFPYDIGARTSGLMQTKTLAAITTGDAPDDMALSFVSALAEHPGTRKTLLCHGFGPAAPVARTETIRKWIRSIQ